MADEKLWDDWSGEEVEAVPEETLPAPIEADSVDSEIATIEKRISVDRRGYFNDPKTQARYQELIAERDGIPLEETEAKTTTENDTPKSKEVDVSPEVQEEILNYWKSEPGQKILHEWNRVGGIEESAKSALKLTEDFKKTLPIESRADFETHVGALSTNTQIAMMSELQNPYVTRSIMASADEVKLFASNDPGAELIAEWGQQAARKVGIIRARAARIAAHLSDEEYKSFDYYLAHAPATEFKAMANYLARSA